jgi:putative hydrolase of the HAD superfamily
VGPSVPAAPFTIVVVTASSSGRRPLVLALDVDGVLLDPTLGGRGGWSTVVGSHFGVDADRLQAVFFQRSWPDVIVGRRPIEPALADAIEELGWTMTVEDLLTSWFEADFAVDVDVVTAATLWSADGVRLVLMTNQEHRRAHFLEQRLSALLPIDSFVYSAAVGFMKKDPEFFPAAHRQIGIPHDDRHVVFVDDSLENIGAARRHGWTALHFSKDNDWRSEIGAALSHRD